MSFPIDFGETPYTPTQAFAALNSENFAAPVSWSLDDQLETPRTFPNVTLPEHTSNPESPVSEIADEAQTSSIALSLLPDYVSRPIDVAFAYIKGGRPFYEKVINIFISPNIEDLSVSTFHEVMIELYLKQIATNKKPPILPEELQLKYKTSTNAAFKVDLSTDLLQKYLEFDRTTSPLFYVLVAPKIMSREEFKKKCAEFEKTKAVTITIQQLKEANNEIKAPEVAWKTWKSMFESGSATLNCIPFTIGKLFEPKVVKPLLVMSEDQELAKNLASFVSSRLTALDLERKRRDELERKFFFRTSKTMCWLGASEDLHKPVQAPQLNSILPQFQMLKTLINKQINSSLRFI
ncbi:hypothetical protein P9112_006909 [Eukaryota sp. TZLM1-RC]